MVCSPSRSGPSRPARSSSLPRSSDFTAALARCAASSVSQETALRPTATSASRTSGVPRSPAVNPYWKAPTTTSAMSMAWATTSAAPAAPSATTANRKTRVARA